VQAWPGVKALKRHVQAWPGVKALKRHVQAWPGVKALWMAHAYSNAHERRLLRL
jgi:hypothetical protein